MKHKSTRQQCSSVQTNSISRMKSKSAIFNRGLFSSGGMNFRKFEMSSVNTVIDGQGHAKTCLMPYAKNKGAYQPAHPRSLISIFVGHCLDNIICILAISKVSRF